MPRETTAQHTPTTLRTLATQLKESALLIEAGAEAVDALQLSALTVRHANSANIGMRGLDAFVSALRDAIREEGARTANSASDSRTQRPKNKDLASTKGRKTDP